MRVFIMDTWAYPYRIPIFEELAKQIELELFFSKPIPRAHMSGVSLDQLGERVKSGKLWLAYMPWHLLWRKYDAYLVGQIGIQSALGACLTMVVAKLRSKPLVLWTDYIETQHYIETKPWKYCVGNLIRRMFTSQCTAALAFGKCTADYLKKITKNRLKIFEVKQVVPEVCNYPADEAARGHRYGDKCVLFCMSYFQKSKGLGFLIETFREMNDDRAMLILAGIGKDEEWLKGLAGGCDRIEFCGYLDAKDKAKYFSMADVFVFTSDHDTWGLVINEAMVYGLPVVVTNSCGAHELVKDNGFVIPPRDKNALKKSLQQLIDSPLLREEMSKKSRSYISQYGLAYGVSSFMNVIEYATSKNQ